MASSDYFSVECPSRRLTNERVYQLHERVCGAQDELGRVFISTLGCTTAAGAPTACNSQGVFDLRWESQLQVRPH